MLYKHNIQSKEYINENGKSKDKKSIGEKLRILIPPKFIFSKNVTQISNHPPAKPEAFKL
jgi:hypothetical protein